MQYFYVRRDRCKIKLEKNWSLLSRHAGQHTRFKVGRMKKNGFADRLKTLLEQKGLTLAQVAKGIKTSAPSVHRWTHGGEIEYDNLRLLADFLEVNWIWLRYGDDALASAQEAIPDQGVMTDMRREYLSQIMDSESRMKTALEMAQIVSWEWNALTGTLTCTANAEAVFGQSPENIRAQLVPFESLKLEELITLFDGDQPYNWDSSLTSAKDGGEQWFASRGQLVFDSLQRPLKVVAVSADITARKQAEQARERSEYMMRKIIETIPVGLWAADEQGRICLSNPEVERIWGGVKFVELENYGEYKGWWERSGQEVGPTGWTLARAVKYGEVSSGEVVNIEAFDGVLRTIIMHATPLVDAQNKIIGAIEVNQDITELKKIERSLTESLVQWEAVYEQPLFGVVHFNEKGEILRANTRLCELISRDTAQLVGENIESVFDQPTTQAMRDALAARKDGLNAFKLTGMLGAKGSRKAIGKTQIAVDLYLINDMRETKAGKNIAFVFTTDSTHTS